MDSANGNGAENGRPRLVFFFSKASGRSRRVEGYLSQVLQRRRNHQSFDLLNVDVDGTPSSPGASRSRRCRRSS
jgi:hypothetical protein